MSWSIPGSATTDALDPSIVNTGANSISAMINFVTLSQARVAGSRYPLATLHYPLQFGGRAFGPPLCRGCAPATPPSKTMPQRPFVVIPAVRPIQGGGCQPNTHRQIPNPTNDRERANEGPTRNANAIKNVLQQS